MQTPLTRSAFASEAEHVVAAPRASRLRTPAVAVVCLSVLLAIAVLGGAGTGGPVRLPLGNRVSHPDASRDWAVGYDLWTDQPATIRILDVQLRDPVGLTLADARLVTGHDATVYGYFTAAPWDEVGRYVPDPMPSASGAVAHLSPDPRAATFLLLRLHPTSAERATDTGIRVTYTAAGQRYTVDSGFVTCFGSACSDG